MVARPASLHRRPKATDVYLRSLVGMMDHITRLALFDRHVESIEHELGLEIVTHRPADDTPREGVEDNGQIEKARPCREWSKKRLRASPPRTVHAPFSAYGSPFKLGPWP